MNKPLLAAISKLLHPLVRILLRNGVPYAVFSDLAKLAYVRVAGKEFDIPKKKQTISRISVITGLSRREVGRVKNLGIHQDAEAKKKANRAARVIGGWIQDGHFLDSKGTPKVLPVDGPGATFSELVKKFSGNIPVRAILDELLRIGAVEQLADNRLRLRVRAYLPWKDQAGMLKIMGTDVKDLIRTIDHNLRASTSKDKVRYFQRKVFYDNLPSEALPVLRLHTQTKAQNLLEGINKLFSRHDRDSNPSVKGTGRLRAGIGIYYFEEDFEDGGDS